MRQTKSIKTQNLVLALEANREEVDRLRQEMAKLLSTNKVLHQQLQQKVDQSMIESRIKLASTLGQLIEAVTRTVNFVVAKEVL